MHKLLEYFWEALTETVNLMFIEVDKKERNRKLLMLQHVRFAKVYQKDETFRKQADAIYEAYKLEFGYDE